MLKQKAEEEHVTCLLQVKKNQLIAIFVRFDGVPY